MERRKLENAPQTGMCPHGNFPGGCEICLGGKNQKEDPYTSRGNEIVEKFEALDEQQQAAVMAEMRHMARDHTITFNKLPDSMEEIKEDVDRAKSIWNSSSAVSPERNDRENRWMSNFMDKLDFLDMAIDRITKKNN